MIDRKEEIRKLIEKFIAIAPTQNEEDRIVARIGELNPDPDWSGYIFYSKYFKREDGSADVENIVEKYLNTNRY